MQPTINRDRFNELARDYSIVPIAVELLADRHTPVSVFESLVAGEDGFLLESVEGGERWARWSFIGWNPSFTVTSVGGSVSISDPGVGLPDGDPLEALATLIDRYDTPDPEALGFDGPVPPLHSGAVGYLAYDTVRYIEHLPNGPHDDRGLPEMVWHFGGGVAAFDRLRDTIVLIQNVIVSDAPDDDYDRAIGALEAAAALLGADRTEVPRPRPAFNTDPVASANMSRDAYEAAVSKAVDYIVAGDAFQIVPSIRFETNLDGDPFSLYRALRLVNPSPFMFFVRHGSIAIAGSSPELMTRVRDGIAYSRPIAGTKPRGATADEDARLAEELLADPKERAEHVMLIDLARNDLGRVCEFGTVTVDDLMVIERYSHVMHIVSGVSGTVREGIGPVDVLRATFPHGTVSGAPKVRAMEIIDELEPTARGP